MNNFTSESIKPIYSEQWSPEDAEQIAILDHIQQDYATYDINTDDGAKFFVLHPDHEVQCLINRVLLGIYCRKKRPLVYLKVIKNLNGKEKLIVEFAKDIPCEIISKIPAIFAFNDSQKYSLGIELRAVQSVIESLSDQERLMLSTFIPNMYSSNEQSQDYVTTLNKFQKRLNAEMCSEKIKKQLNNRKSNRLRGKKRCVKLVEAMRCRYSKILVVRIDFGIMRTPESLASNLICPTREESEQDNQFIQNSLKRLNGNARHNRLQHAIAHIQRIEYAPQKGFHVHAYYFFDGNQHQEDISWGKYIAKQWKLATDNIGTAFICNMKKEDYRHCALGMLEYYDTVMLENLYMSFDYICKNDQYFQFTTKKNFRSLRTSSIPDVPKIKLGRPRKYNPKGV